MSIHNTPHIHFSTLVTPRLLGSLVVRVYYSLTFLDLAMFCKMYSFWILYRMFLCHCIYTCLFHAYHVNTHIFYFWQLNSRSRTMLVVLRFFRHAMLVHFLGFCKLLHTLYNTCTFTFLSAIDSCDILYFAHLYLYRLSSVYCITQLQFWQWE